MHKDQLLDEFMFWLDMHDEDELRVIVCETMAKIGQKTEPEPFMFRPVDTNSGALVEFVERVFLGSWMPSGAVH